MADAGVTRLIYCQHGATRNPTSYFDAINPAADAVGVSVQHARSGPAVPGGRDLVLPEADESLLYFGSGWRDGDKSHSTSQHPRPFRISNFEVVDRLLLRCAETFPNLKELVVVGHSAGGQFANRYSIANRAAAALAEQYGIHVRYIVFNPSSFLYFDERRWDSTTDTLKVPEAEVIAAAPHYNRFKYGLEAANSYFSQTPIEQLRQAFATTTSCLLGELDDDPEHESLDKSSAAMAMTDAAVAGIYYFKSLQGVFGPEIHRHQRIAILPEVRTMRAKVSDPKPAATTCLALGSATTGRSTSTESATTIDCRVDPVWLSCADKVQSAQG